MEADFIVKYGSNVYVEHSKALDPDLVGFLVGSNFIVKHWSNVYDGLRRVWGPYPAGFLVGSNLS